MPSFPSRTRRQLDLEIPTSLLAIDGSRPNVWIRTACRPLGGLTTSRDVPDPKAIHLSLSGANESSWTSQRGLMLGRKEIISRLVIGE